ncbi:MAG TPA: alpha/beta fold hydrolase [Crenotrichaceae bacterium]|nr:alpha/beta fold hydrolase [Crenotrichaceae bacterium]
MKCVERKYKSINHRVFRTMIYLAIKQLQSRATLSLHESIRNPEVYRNLLTQPTHSLKRFINMAVDNNLIRVVEKDYLLLPKIAHIYSVDEMRMQNLIAVYANEVAVIDEVNQAINDSFEQVLNIDNRQLARMRFHDEIVLLKWDKEHAPQPDNRNHSETDEYQVTKKIDETATEDPAPFLLEPGHSGCKYGVLLIHGLLASPAEVRPFAEYLVTLGYTVLGIRLKGHGTTPLELATVDKQNWYESALTGFEILSELVEYIHLVGFSTGGALALILASEQRKNVESVVAICVPVKFKNPNMMLISLLHGVNRFTQWIATKDVVKAFVLNDTEHPHINYRHVPVNALYELRQLIDELELKIQSIHCPVALLQAQNDPVVDPSSALKLYEELSTEDATLMMVPASKHGILYQNTEHIWERISGYLSIAKKQ